MADKTGWIAVDLDGTLAEYHGWVSVEHIGAPVPKMLKRVKGWLADGKDVRIFTARVDGGEVAVGMGNEAGEQFRNVAYVKSIIEAWCLEHIGRVLPVTNRKDYGMVELWDDRCRHVQENTGITDDEIIADLSIRLGQALNAAGLSKVESDDFLKYYRKEATRT